MQGQSASSLRRARTASEGGWESRYLCGFTGSGRWGGEVSRRQAPGHWTARLRVCQTPTIEMAKPVAANIGIANTEAPTIGMETGCLSPEEGRVRQEGKFRNSKARAPTIGTEAGGLSLREGG